VPDAAFIDTSALYALLDADTEEHPPVARAWRDLLESNAGLVTTNYTVLESMALTQRRLGFPALLALLDYLLPWIEVAWVDEELHQAGLSALLAAGRRDLSLVDCVSFAFMGRRGLSTALTLDAHFEEHGFRRVHTGR